MNLKMIKTDFENKLINSVLKIAVVTPIIFGITFPIVAKLKGLAFSTAVISAFVFIQRLAGLVQPILYKKKVSIKSLFIVMVVMDILWSINIFCFTIFNNVTSFLVIHILLNIILDVIYTSVTFKTEKRRDTFLENFKDLIEQAKPLL